jgi:hypothetical protein
MKYVGWDEKNPGGGGGGMFLKLEAGKKYRIRLIGKPACYNQHWEPVICRSPGVDPDTKKTLDPLMLQGFTPKKRFAMWVIDREDGNKLKIMDFPPVLFEQFAEWKTSVNEDPGGQNGCDWSIKLEIPGGDRRRTKYKATSLAQTPLTEEELKAIKEGGLKEKLYEARKANTPEEIRAMLAQKTGADPSGPSDPVVAGASQDAVSTGAAPSSEKPKNESKDFDF